MNQYSRLNPYVARTSNTHLSLNVTRVTLPKLPVPRNTSVWKSSGVKRSSNALPINL